VPRKGEKDPSFLENSPTVDVGGLEGELGGKKGMKKKLLAWGGRFRLQFFNKHQKPHALEKKKRKN